MTRESTPRRGISRWCCLSCLCVRWQGAPWRWPFAGRPKRRGRAGRRASFITCGRSHFARYLTVSSRASANALGLPIGSNRPSLTLLALRLRLGLGDGRGALLRRRLAFGRGLGRRAPSHRRLANQRIGRRYNAGERTQRGRREQRARGRALASRISARDEGVRFSASPRRGHNGGCARAA